MASTMFCRSAASLMSELSLSLGCRTTVVRNSHMVAASTGLPKPAPTGVPRIVLMPCRIMAAMILTLAISLLLTRRVKHCPMTPTKLVSGLRVG